MAIKWSHRQALIDKRRQLGLGLRQLADELGVAFSTIARIETGVGEPSTHVRGILQRWLFPEQEHKPCPCVRCVGAVHVPSLTERVTALEAAVDTLQREALHNVHRRIG